MRDKVLVWIFLVLVGSGQVVSGQNLLSNPGFESGLSEWDNGSWGGGAATITSSTDEFKQGKQAAKYEITAATPGEAGKVYLRKNGLQVVPGNMYTLSFYVLSHSAQTEAIDLSLYSHTNVGSSAWGQAYESKGIEFQGDGIWKGFSFDFVPTVVAGSPDFNHISLMFGLGQNASIIYIDEVSLVLKEENGGSVDGSNYHVSKTGNDTNNGTPEAPFLSISKAASIAGPGDTVFIHEGSYEETLKPIRSGTVGSPIVFQSMDKHKVIITAMQALSGWSHDVGSIYKTNVPWDLGQLNFVMNGSTACDLARWPNNSDGDLFTLNSLRNTGGSGKDDVDAHLTYAGIPDHDWSKGGSIFFYGDLPGGGWTAWKAWIQNSSAGRVDFSLNKNPSWIRTFHYPSAGGDFYLEGIKEALDYKNEWYYNDADKTLFIQLPDGAEPKDMEVQMRRRKLTVDLNGRNYVQIKNLALFGGGVEINGTGNILTGISSFYGNMTRGIVSGFKSNSQSVKVSGSNNVIEKCEIAYGSGSGIFSDGYYTHVVDCSVHDFDFLGCYDAPMLVRGGNGALIKNNEIYRGGRDAMQITTKNSEVSFNNIHHSNLIADDCALLYTLGAGLNMKIHHNWFHDAFGRGKLKKAAGIYLDNDAGNVDVHHNVVYKTEWSSIQINWNGTNLNIFNNTLWDGSNAMGAWHKDGTAFSNVKVWNTLTNMNSLEPQADKQNNKILSSGANPFNGEANFDFTLKSGETAIDFGKEIEGVTTGFIGAAPDAGAYESGKTPWQAGVTWDPDLGPVGNGCYGLPGNKCVIQDTDGDGVPDDIDQCPDTAEGLEVNEQGCSTVGLSISEIDRVDVYPNPIIGNKIWIRLANHDVQHLNYSINDLNGCVILNGTLKCMGEIGIDVSELNNGIFVLQLTLNQTRYTKKVLKL